jgi:hypothetical protein
VRIYKATNRQLISSGPLLQPGGLSYFPAAALSDTRNTQACGAVRERARSLAPGSTPNRFGVKRIVEESPVTSVTPAEALSLACCPRAGTGKDLSLWLYYSMIGPAHIMSDDNLRLPSSALGERRHAGSRRLIAVRRSCSAHAARDGSTRWLARFIAARRTTMHYTLAEAIATRG